MKQAMIKLCPASIPLMPAYILMELVQKTASDPIYIWYNIPKFTNGPTIGLINLGMITLVTPL